MSLTMTMALAPCPDPDHHPDPVLSWSSDPDLVLAVAWSDTSPDYGPGPDIVLLAPNLTLTMILTCPVALNLILSCPVLSCSAPACPGPCTGPDPGPALCCPDLYFMSCFVLTCVILPCSASSFTNRAFVRASRND